MRTSPRDLEARVGRPVRTGTLNTREVEPAELQRLRYDFEVWRDDQLPLRLRRAARWNDPLMLAGRGQDAAARMGSAIVAGTAQWRGAEAADRSGR
jgi:hypothetical protein